MHFLRPNFLLLILPMLLVCWRLWRHPPQNSQWSKACDPHLLAYLQLDSNHGSSKWWVPLCGLTMLLAVLALGGPCWKKNNIPVFSSLSPLVVVFDLSGSMLVKDISPSRLQRAKYKITDLINMRRDGATALLAFTGEPFVVTPLTQDAATIINLLPALKPLIMPVQGYDLLKALKEAKALIQQSGASNGQVLVVSANGASAKAIEYADQLAQEGIAVSVLGVGTVSGGPIPMDDGQLLKDRSGNVVNAKLEESELKRLAASGKGRYVRIAHDPSDLSALKPIVMRQGHARMSENSVMLWQDEGHWLILLMLPLILLLFRRGVML